MKTRLTHGSALIVGMVFLLILTILGVAGMKMARLELLMAGNAQFFAQAMHAAEAAVEKQIMDGDFSVSYDTPSNPLTADSADNVEGISTIEFVNQGMAPDGGFSDDIMTYRFRIDAYGKAPATNTRAEVSLRQGVYLLAPSEN